MEWKYKLHFNGVYWKGFGARPTILQIEINKNQFINSDSYTGGNVRIEVVRVQ